MIVGVNVRHGWLYPEWRLLTISSGLPKEHKLGWSHRLTNYGRCSSLSDKASTGDERHTESLPVRVTDSLVKSGNEIGNGRDHVSGESLHSGVRELGSSLLSPNTHATWLKLRVARRYPSPLNYICTCASTKTLQSPVLIHCGPRFTFLATLFLLLGISALIVFRSLVIRRRLERRINHAIREGLVAAPRAPGSKHSRLTKKPKLHDVWVECGGGTWEEVQVGTLSLNFIEFALVLDFMTVPFSIFSYPNRTMSNTIYATQPLSLRLKADRTRAEMASRPRLIAVNESAFWSMILSNNPMRAPSQAEAPNKLGALDDSKAEGPSPTETMVQVSVLVALPSQSPYAKGDGDGERGLPEVAIGVARLPYRSLKPVPETGESPVS